MQDSKNMAWAQTFDAATEEATNSDTDRNSDIDAANEADPDGWQQYRRWISKTPSPRGRRTGLDPSLYTWKGYRSWSEQVKRNWREN